MNMNDEESIRHLRIKLQNQYDKLIEEANKIKDKIIAINAVWRILVEEQYKKEKKKTNKSPQTKKEKR